MAWFFHHKKKSKKPTVPTVKVGSPEFANMEFCLKHGIDKKNIVLFDFNGFRMHQYSDQIYMMVVFSHGSNIMLMIAAPSVQHHTWALSFCSGGWNRDHEVTYINPLNFTKSTGAGLNVISHYDHQDADRLLSMFTFLRTSKRGEWLKVRQ